MINETLNHSSGYLQISEAARKSRFTIRELITLAALEKLPLYVNASGSQVGIWVSAEHMPRKIALQPMALINGFISVDPGLLSRISDDVPQKLHEAFIEKFQLLPIDSSTNGERISSNNFDLSSMERNGLRMYLMPPLSFSIWDLAAKPEELERIDGDDHFRKPSRAAPFVNILQASAKVAEHVQSGDERKQYTAARAWEKKLREDLVAGQLTAHDPTTLLPIDPKQPEIRTALYRAVIHHQKLKAWAKALHYLDVDFLDTALSETYILEGSGQGTGNGVPEASITPSHKYLAIEMPLVTTSASELVTNSRLMKEFPELPKTTWRSKIREAKNNGLFECRVHNAGGPPQYEAEPIARWICNQGIVSLNEARFRLGLSSHQPEKAHLRKAQIIDSLMPK